MKKFNYKDDKITEMIIQCIIRVHKILGPGFLESIYKNALLIELKNSGLKCEAEKLIKIYYNNIEIGTHRLDIVVENKIIIELKTVEELCGQHYAQIKSYLRATNLKTGILVNFAKEKADFRRIENEYTGIKE
ncbi:MAG: GxxExxY protein [Candidatus Cloacimonadota bacterium]|nr:GxxExxY protein [Candidatus Cloacimonadota bacterium]